MRAQDQPDALARFVDHHDASDLSLSQAEQIRDALSEVTVVDPACGSGAYLVGMMQELVDLRVELYNQKLKQDPHSLYELKLHIIRAQPPRRRPRSRSPSTSPCSACGSRSQSSSTAHNLSLCPIFTSRSSRATVSSRQIPASSTSTVTRLGSPTWGRSKARHMRARTGVEKARLSDLIKDVENQIRIQLGEAIGPEKVIDWRIKFAEVFAERGGFDIVVANPPYVKTEHQNEGNRGALSNQYGWTGDLYEYFIARGIQLTSPTGLISYIANDSFVTFSQKRKVRDVILDNRLRLLTKTPAETFNATIYAAILLISHGHPASDHAYHCGALIHPDFNFVPYGLVPYSTVLSLPDKRLLLSSEYDLFVRLMSHPKAKAVCQVLDAGIHSGNVRAKIFFSDDDGTRERLLQG